jgi:uncharacterized protein (TIGR00661 family)
MKYLFVIQGDGRGHMTQALALSDMLRRNGHEVAEVLLGRSISRDIPSFFKDKINAPVHTFETFSFIFDKDNRNVDMLKTGIYNLNAKVLLNYGKSLRFIRERIRESGADVVISFYEILMGFYRLRFHDTIPIICIAHQFITEHPDFTHAKGVKGGMLFLQLATLLANRGATKTLVLSFYPMPPVEDKSLYVVPPLLRREVPELTPAKGNFLLGYMLNQGYEQEIRAWHEEHPEIEIRFFWDKKDAPKEWKVDETFTLYSIDDELFLKNMAACRAYITTAGFESVCEALYLDKPVMLIPAHIEQEVNAADAHAFAGCVVGDSFDLSRLMEYAEEWKASDGAFKKWVDSAETVFLKHLTEI